MKQAGKYLPEHSLLAAALVLTATGFWDIYFGDSPAPGSRQHFHLVANLLWLTLLTWQLRLAATGNFAGHRVVGTWVLLLAPLLFASTSMLSVHSAHKGMVSGLGDALIVQNVMGTLEFGLLVLLAFVFRKRRRLHGALLLSTAILFMGIALFFTLIGLVPAFRIEGPETFHRFASAAMTGQAVCLAVGLAFVARDWRNGWPFLLAALFFPLNELLRVLLAEIGLIQPLTRFVGSLGEIPVLAGSFALMLGLLLAMGIGRSRPAMQPGWQRTGAPE